jgi:putative heme-binding domain-containing protein
MPIFKALLPTSDARLQTMLWWLLEAKCESDRDLVLGVFEDKSVWSQPVCKTKLLNYLGKRWAMAGGELNFQSLTKLVSLAPDNEARGLVIAGIAAAFEGAEMPKLPDELSKALADYTKAQGGGDLTLALRSGDKEALKEALKTIGNKSRPSAKRAALALTLAELGKKEVLDAIAPIFSAGGNESLKRAMLPAVAKFDDHKLIRLMLDGWEQRMASEKALREAALRMMAGRKEWAKMLLAMVDSWQIPAKHFTPDIVRQLSVFNDADINASIEKHWKGLLANAPTEETMKEAARIRAVLKAGKGDAEKGKAIFTQRCFICHRLFGEGNQVGPELTGYERGNLDFWLNNVLTPSLEIREGFGAYTIELNNGQILMGMIAAQDAKTISLRDVANQITKINLTDIKKQTASPVSLMPPGLLAGIADGDLRDFFAYLMKSE